MKFSDAFSDKIGFGAGTEGSTEDYLVVTPKLSYLVESEDDLNSERPRAIFVSEPSINDELLKLEAVAIGTMVSFEGKATVAGTFVKTGMSLMPVAITREKHHIYRSGGNT